MNELFGNSWLIFFSLFICLVSFTPFFCCCLLLLLINYINDDVSDDDDDGKLLCVCVKGDRKNKHFFPFGTDGIFIDGKNNNNSNSNNQNIKDIEDHIVK